MPAKKTTKKKATKPKTKAGGKVKLMKTKNNRYYMKAANGRAKFVSKAFAEKHGYK